MITSLPERAAYLRETEILGHAERRSVRLTQAALLLWLDERDNMLCELSAEENEWPSGHRLRNLAKRLKMLERIAHYNAEAACDRPLDLIWAILDKLADEHGYTKQVNWSLHSGDSR